MISLATIGLLTAWSITSICGGVTYCCCGRRRANDGVRYFRSGSSRPSLPNLKSRSTTATTATHTLDSLHTFDDDTLTESSPERIVLYLIRPDPENAKVVNVLDSSEENTLYRFVKPGVRLLAENIFWNHDCYFETVNGNTSRIASIYNGTVGKGGYVEILSNDIDDDFFLEHEDISLDTCTVDDGPEESLIYKLLSFKFKLRNSFSNPIDTRRIALQTEALSNSKPLTIGEKIFVSSKLAKEAYEFKLTENADTTYKWSPSTGQLIKVDKFDKQKQVAQILKGETRRYFIEVNETEINPVIALTISMIVKQSW